MSQELSGLVLNEMRMTILGVPRRLKWVKQQAMYKVFEAKFSVVLGNDLGAIWVK